MSSTHRKWLLKQPRICVCCKRKIRLLEGKLKGNHLTADHIVPRSLGGTGASNRQVLCRNCNVAKGNIPFDFKTKTFIITPLLFSNKILYKKVINYLPSFKKKINRLYKK